MMQIEEEFYDLPEGNGVILYTYFCLILAILDDFVAKGEL